MQQRKKDGGMVREKTEAITRLLGLSGRARRVQTFAAIVASLAVLYPMTASSKVVCPVRKHCCIKMF